jgi:hypothetical protein
VRGAEIGAARNHHEPRRCRLNQKIIEHPSHRARSLDGDERQQVTRRLAYEIDLRVPAIHADATVQRLRSQQANIPAGDASCFARVMIC